MYGLKCEFTDFPTMLIKYFNSCISEQGKPAAYKCIIMMSSDSSARFHFF